MTWFTRAIAVACWVAAAASCSSPVTADAGEPDAGLVGPSCDSPEDCKSADFAGVCRQNICVAEVPCGDDVECGLGERCSSGHCRFTGCAQDSECNSGKCRLDAFSCEECGADDACPFDRPRCDTAAHRCVNCLSDAECPVLGPGRCSALGQCLHCAEDKHCPNGLSCSAAGVCVGSPLNGLCSAGIACGQGLLCVTVGTEGRCLSLCNLFHSQCPSGQICYTPYASASQLVFEQGQPVGFCFTPQSGLRGPNEPCIPSAAGSNCQRNLECVPQTATSSSCRNFCDPSEQNNCGSGDKCHPFSGDYQGHRYGLCYPDNGWGDDCGGDGGCKSGQLCRLMPDPAALNDFALKCQFPVGPSPGLSPCSSGASCQSGACREDSAYGTANYFCFQHCESDEACAISGRAGRCDGDFLFNEGNSFGYVSGCRPHCTSSADCGAYDGGMVCRARLDVTADVKELRQACADPLGSAELGEGCSADTQCRSGFCRSFDWRGVRRQGLCSVPCQLGSDCGLADGGASSTPLCAVAPYFAANGPDGLPATADDVAFTASLCAGKTCVDDGECASDGGSVCAPSGEVTDAGWVLRCLRAASNGATTQGAASCVTDSQCLSGVCGELMSSTGRVCLMSCGGGTACPSGTTCRDAGLRIASRSGPLLVPACVP